jgi:hypothetical protein
MDGGIVCLEVEGAAAVGCPSDGHKNSGVWKERNARAFHRQPLHIMIALMYLSFCTLQVITFLYTVLRCAKLDLRTALVVTPVNVLHNWRKEFTKWCPAELKPLRVFMLEDVTRCEYDLFLFCCIM